MTRDNLCHAFMVIMALLAARVAVSDVGRPAFSGQPALVNHAAYGVDGPTGFDQAQEVSLKIHAEGEAK